MTTVSLNTALSGLKAAQQALNTVSNNIANASTPGYTRKILPQQTLVVGGTGAGVTTGGLVRNVDKTLMKSLFGQVSATQSALVKSNYLDRVQDFHGASEAQTALSNRIGNLSDAFTALSSGPDSTVYLNQTVQAAQTLAKSFNDYTTLINDLRQQSETEISAYVTEVNNSLKQIAELNVQIAQLTAGGQSSADLEDQRDTAIRNVSQYIQISTFTDQNNVVVVSTKQGQALADTKAQKLVFNASEEIATSSYYPGGGLGGLYINSTGGIEISQSAIGGAIGGLFELRDEILPQYQAQVDELAQKMAERFDTLGLRLFTDADGNVPASVAPPAAVTYSGFAGEIRVNTNIVNDPTLLRSGTNGGVVQTGSNSVINRITSFAFGNVAAQNAAGTIDITGNIFTAASLTQVNHLSGNVNLNTYTPDLSDATNLTLPAAFDLTIGGTTQTINIGAADTPVDLVNTINAAFGPGTAAINALGQLSFTASEDITLADNTIGAAGMADLGFTFGTYPASNPAFSVSVNGQPAVTVTILPTDTETDLLNKLNAIPGLTATQGTGGILQLVPDEGGSLSFQNVTGTPVGALGLSITNVNHTSFRQNNLGPAGNLSTGLAANSSIGDYAKNLVTQQSATYNAAQSTYESEESYLATLDSRNSSISGVDLDQEIAELIRVQTAYTAAARMITATEELFDTLFAAVQ
ncbi:MAG TPA: flagellar hook-associated protein FlgK [Alphaproteobacteria bacterium]|nr:flagellar hook-associated protein FlgK [Rhodospirillaceae bacterium]HRJ65778.1 flagellar hook-associated protein FlgK [Alphaproteobacteria bacterium]